MKWYHILFLIIMGVAALTGLGFAIYVYVVYGNTPIDELPAWVLPFFIK